MIARHILTATPQGAHILLALQLRGPLAWFVRLLGGRRLVRYLRMEAAGLTGP